MPSSKRQKKKKPLVNFSPQIKRKSSKDKVYLKELSNLVSLHEIEVVSKNNKHESLFYMDYDTSKGKIRIISVFTEDNKITYLFIAFLDEIENIFIRLSTDKRTLIEG